jgi:hypothetical protein
MERAGDGDVDGSDEVASSRAAADAMSSDGRVIELG